MCDGPTYIYTLCEPESDVVRYVGKTVDLQRRYSEHLSRTSKPKNHRERWLMSLALKGLQPTLRVIETIPSGGDWASSERFWIRYYRECGYDLVNLTDGGEGVSGRVATEETRRKIGAGHRGKTIKPDVLERKVASTYAHNESALCAAFGMSKEELAKHLRDIYREVGSLKRLAAYVKEAVPDDSDVTWYGVKTLRRIIGFDKSVDYARPHNAKAVDIVMTILAMYDDGFDRIQIAKAVGVHKDTVRNYIRKYRSEGACFKGSFSLSAEEAVSHRH